MIEIFTMFVCIINLFLLLGLMNEVIDLNDFIFYKEVMMNESDIQNNREL